MNIGHIPLIILLFIIILFNSAYMDGIVKSICENSYNINDLRTSPYCCGSAILFTSLGFEKAYLVESYTNKKGLRTMYVNEVNYDSDYTNEIILDRLKKFITFFEFLMSNETLKEGLLNGDKDRKIFKLYESEFLGIELSF